MTEGRAGRGIYVETLIDADLETLWQATQDPALHARWDLRFSRIVPTGERDGAQMFRYERSVWLHTVHGVGVSIGESQGADGARTSALRFSTDDKLSPLREGRGYWRYIPGPRGVRFITGYDYRPGFGILDVIVRPLVGWATAWSFDRLRIWLERGEAPEQWPLRSVLWVWRADRPRAARCVRAPRGGRRRADHLQGAPATLSALPHPGRVL